MKAQLTNFIWAVAIIILFAIAQGVSQL